MRCEISVNYSVKEHNGKYIVKDQTVKFRVDNKKIPLAIELGVVEMRAGNKRTILSPPNLLTISDDILIKDIDYDEENISIIDLSLDIKQEVAAHHSTVEKYPKEYS